MMQESQYLLAEQKSFIVKFIGRINNFGSLKINNSAIKGSQFTRGVSYELGQETIDYQ